MSKDLTLKLNGSLEDKIDRLIVLFESMDSRLGNLETLVDKRLKDTQPIWEAVQAQLAEIKQEQQSFRAETEKGFRTIDRRMERQIGEFERLHAYQRDLEDRVDKLERPSI